MSEQKKVKEITDSQLIKIKPVTDNQKVTFEAFKKGQNIFQYGAAGTGKTFVALYLALKEVLDLKSPYDRVCLVRSLMTTKDISFIPSNENDTALLYQTVYQNMVQFMFEQPNEDAFSSLYDRLKAQQSLYFLSTSFLRGLTFDNSIIVVDECQNLNFHELDTIITRVGQNSRIIFCGDVDQSDLVRTQEKNGILDFTRVLEQMDEFTLVEYNLGDIVRSGFVRNYLINKIKLGLVSG
jgi:predicted ribonuclease YlaK|tara:strand:+ start:4201 stop:4914 length:714 start_codon:yes stop_codon:yes gene_type:complete